MSTLRRITDFVLGSRFQAMGAALVISCIPLLGSIGVLIAGLVTLRKGALEGLLVLIAATLPYIFKYYSYSSGSELAFLGLMLTLTSNALIWVFAIILRRYSNWNAVLEYALLIGVAAIGMTHLLYPEVATWWGTQMTQYLSKTTAMVGGLNTSSDETQAQVIELMKGINAKKRARLMALANSL